MKKMKISTIIIISILLVILVGTFSLAKTMGEKQYLDENGQIRVSTLKELFGGYSNVYCVEHYQQMCGGTYTRMVTIEIDGDYTKITVPGQTEPIFEGNNSYSNKIAAAVHLDTLDNIENYDGLWNNGRWYSAGQLVLWQFWSSWRNELNDAAKKIIKPCTQDSSYNAAMTNAAIKVVEEYAAKNKYKATIHYIGILPEYSGEYQSTSQKLILVENSEDTPKVEIPVKKVWEDKNNQDGIRPESIQVKLLANGKEVKDEKGNVKIITLNKENNWFGKFIGLEEKDSDGNIIDYEVVEVSKASGYEIRYGKDIKSGVEIFTITNTHIPEKVKFSIEKDWQDDNNRDGKRTTRVEVNFYANNEIKEKITLDESNNWKYETGELDKYSNGKEIDYRFEEITVIDGYENSIIVTKIETVEGVTSYKVTVINEHKPELIEIPVTKIWDDDDNRDGKRPTVIEVTLYADGEKVTTDANGNQIDNPIILNESNEWKHTFTNLYKYKDNGKEIVYSVEETPLSEELKYEEPEINGDKTTGYTIINTHEPERTKIKVVKQWNDVDDLDEYRPKSITLKLLANGEPAKDANGNDVSTIVLSAPTEFSNTWEYEVTDLYKYENGEEIQYTIEEENVPEHYTKGEMEKEVLIDEDGMQIIVLKIENKHEPHYDGYIEITGKVWVDKPDGKGNNINGKLDEHEAGLEGIKVILKDAQGNQFDISSTATTDKDGNYTIKVNYDNSPNVYKLYEDAAKVREKIKKSYIEFEYDGMKYTTVATATTGANTSKAIENETTRNSFDSAHSNVTPSTQHPDNWTDKTITASTKNVILFETYNDKTEITRQEVLKYCNGDGIYVRTNPEGAWNEVLLGTRLDLACRSGNPHVVKEYGIQVEIIQNVNLGLFEREQPDVAIFSDLSKVEVEMQGQRYTYLYNVRSNENNDVGLKVKFQNKDTYTYRRPVNPADIAYIQEETNKDAMSVKVTYEVKIGNLSTTLPIIVSNIVNTYDSRYTLTTPNWIPSNGTQFNQATYNGDLNIKVEPQKESEAIQLTYTVSVEAIRGLLNEEATLNNAVEIQTYSTLYGADTLYAEQRTGGRTNQPYGGYDYNSHPGNAEIFINSEGRLEAGKPEDDTDIAPSFVLELDKEPENPDPNPDPDPDPDPDRPLSYKILSGNVWEDTDIGAETGVDNFRVGDGKKTAGELNLANAKVELYKVKEDGTIELAKLYSCDGGSPRDAVTYSDNEGNYSFGNNEQGYGVVTDKYLFKFTYGEGIDGSRISTIKGVNVNARNYKSTIISEGTQLYNVFKGNSNSDEWHLNIGKGYSIAVDDLEKRVGLSDLQYSNFEEQIHMEAYSKPFKMQVEFDAGENKISQVQEDGKTPFGNELNIFDFGIIERAREDIFTEKTIEYIKITLANGQVLTEGNPTEQELNYAKPIGFSQNITNSESARTALDKQMSIEVDAELLQGAQLDVKYAIKVTNDSEKDYDYYLGDNTNAYDASKLRTEYYYFGTNNEGSPEIKGSVNYLVDYIDTDFTFSWENESDWKQFTADELLAQGLINTKTYEVLKSDKYKAFITEKYTDLQPGQSMKEYAYASKLLANEDENVYENHMEILQIDSKTARTLKGKENDGTPILKQYKMGNYIPSLISRIINTDTSREEPGLHEQDDDRVKIVITVPTGVTNYVMPYVIATLVGLIVMVSGVIFIKKKILKK